jgi:aerobic-type carbon monoxide dehydrogenase small subunit (CoxS/CutS family)
VPDLSVNGSSFAVEAPVGRTLAETLRDDLGLTGTKVACGEGHCGACTVLLDGVPVLSCITLVHTVGARDVTTIEGLHDHPLVDAFVRADALQCGFCTPGQIVSASALVGRTPTPSRDEIRAAMAGNLCRCGAYPRIEEAIASVVMSTATWQLQRADGPTKDTALSAKPDA